MSQDPFIKLLTKQNLLADAHVQNPNFATDVFQSEPASEIKAISHKFTEIKGDTFQNPILTSKPQDWLATSDSLLVREQGKFSVFNLDGSLRWTFSLPKNTQFSSGKIAQLGHAVFLSSTNGRTYSFDFRDGNLIWYLNSSTQIFHAPTLSGTDLILFSEDTDGKSWIATVVNSANGKIIHRLNNLEVALSGDALINDQVLFFATESGHLNAFLLASGKRAWTSEGSSSFKNGPSLVGDKIYLTNEDSLAMSFDIKSGRKTGEVELNTIVPSAFSPIPGTPYLYTTDANGYLLAIDSKLSKRIWRYNLNTSGPSHP
ncbi:MAG: PQQ-binding-like beta-propeller repeat protein, partial [Bdellovibrionales bacterium]